MTLKYIFSLFFLFLIISCKKEIEPKPIYAIDKIFKTYMDAFLYEAKIRNISIDTTNLILKVNSSTITDKCGICTQTIRKPTKQKTIEIYTSTGLCWEAATTNAREALVFHELGHCLLGRIEHKNDVFPDGSPKSIMVESNTDLYTPCEYVIDDNPVACNKTGRRKYYIDELFDPNTPIPSWAK